MIIALLLILLAIGFLGMAVNAVQRRVDETERRRRELWIAHYLLNNKIDKDRIGLYQQIRMLQHYLNVEERHITERVIPAKHYLVKAKAKK